MPQQQKIHKCKRGIESNALCQIYWNFHAIIDSASTTPTAAEERGNLKEKWTEKEGQEKLLV